MTRVELKALKTFNGREGEGYNVSIYFDGRKVADVIDSADGGEPRFFWCDRVAERSFDAYCELQPPIQSCIPGCAPLTADRSLILVGWIVTLQQKRQVARWCKTKTVYRLKGMAACQFNTTATSKDQIRAKHGNEIECFGDDWSLEPGVFAIELTE